MVSNVPLTRMVSAAAVLLLILGGSPAFAQSSPAPSPAPVEPKFVRGNATITLTNDTFTGRTSVIALTSPGDLFELALIQDGFGTSKKFQYCWTEVHNTATGKILTWRAPCHPIKGDGCSLQLTSDGDFVLFVTSRGRSTAAFHSKTTGYGVAGVRLTDQGNLLLVLGNNYYIAWQSSDHVNCTDEFIPSNASHPTQFAWFGLACSILLSTIMALSY